MLAEIDLTDGLVAMGFSVGVWNRMLEISKWEYWKIGYTPLATYPLSKRYIPIY